MALDSLVDSAQLNANLTSVANAIRTKGGTSAQLTFPNEFVSAIAGIPSSSETNYLRYCTSLAFKNRPLPDANPNLTLPQVNSGVEMFYGDQLVCPYKTITVTFGKQIASLQYFAGQYRQDVRGLEFITINGDFSKVTNYSGMVKGNITLKGIYGSPLNFSSITNANLSSWQGGTGLYSVLTYVRYAENTLKVNQSLSLCPALDNDSLVSIANGLVAGAHTLTMHATPKAALSTIMGTVTNNGTYDVFTADAQGTVTLENFITQTKGWTIA